jgi:hypothetical protein
VRRLYYLKNLSLSFAVAALCGVLCQLGAQVAVKQPSGSSQKETNPPTSMPASVPFGQPATSTELTRP